MDKKLLGRRINAARKEGFSDISACGQSSGRGISGSGRAAYALPQGNAEAAQHDNRHDPQRDRSHTGLSASNQRTEKPSG